MIFYESIKERVQFLHTFFLVALIIIGFSFFYFTGNAQGQNSTGNTSLEDLNIGILDIKSKIKGLEKEKEEYEFEIIGLQGQRLSLNREISLLDNRIAQRGVEIETEEAKINQTGLEIQRINNEIEVAKKDIETKKIQLGNVLGRLYREESVDYIQILLLNNNFSDFFDSVKSLENIQSDVYQLVNDLKSHKEKLGDQRVGLGGKKEFQEKLKLSLEEKRAELIDSQGTKAYLVSQTRYDERKFQGLIAEIRREQQNANADIVNLEKRLRDQLRQDELLSSLGADEEFAWPVDSRLITARFHDPSYPYRYVFEHPAIDIAIPQGSPVRATKTGYVGRAKDSGLGYSYILLIHDEGISSVYGHVSSLQVKEDDFVVQGQVIGLSGGAPGSPGAGSFSTGSHLHFEIRQDGIPVNPENYL